MKIALINQTFSLSHGGLERFSVNLATALSREGHDVHALGVRLEDLPRNVVPHPVSAALRPAWWRPLSFSRGVQQVLSGQSFDVRYGLTRCLALDVYRMGDGVQRHWLRLRYPLAPLRWLACLFNPVHLVNLYQESRLFAAGGCRLLITNYRMCKEHAQRYYDVAAERVVVVYNGVDPAVFSPEAVAPLRADCRRELGLRETDLAFLYVSNNWRRKGLAVLLTALAKLGTRGSNVHLVVVGRGRPAPFLRLARRLGIDGRVHFVGTTKVVPRYYAAGDLLVLPTIYDPFANVCLEAMACGLPVVTTSGNGAAELLRPGENGYIQADPGDAEELAQLLGRCLDVDHLWRMGTAARATAAPFTRERNMEQTLAIFRRLLTEQAGT
ncbi:MAG: glycosyltransferase family 4 protein [Desulfuromonadales bacterium]